MLMTYCFGKSRQHSWINCTGSAKVNYIKNKYAYAKYWLVHPLRRAIWILEVVKLLATNKESSARLDTAKASARVWCGRCACYLKHRLMTGIRIYVVPSTWVLIWDDSSPSSMRASLLISLMGESINGKRRTMIHTLEENHPFGNTSYILKCIADALHRDACALSFTVILFKYSYPRTKAHLKLTNNHVSLWGEVNTTCEHRYAGNSRCP